MDGWMDGIGNKQTELSIFLEAHNVKVAAIQESKLTAKSRSPNIQNYTLVRHDRRQGPGGGLLFFIHNSVSFTRKSLSTTSKNDPHLEELTISITMDNTGFQRLPPARGGTAQKNIIHLANWSQLIHPGPASSLTKFFLVSSQSCVSTLTHYSSELRLPRHQGL